MLLLSCIFILWGMAMMRGLYPSIPALLAISNQPINREENRMTSVIPPDCRVFWGAQKKLGSCSWWLFDLSLSRAGYLYLYCCWMIISPLWFFTLFFPNTADGILSLFRIRESIWLPESLSPSEYETAQGKNPVLLGFFEPTSYLVAGAGVYWPEHDTQDVGTRENCLTVTWVGVSPAI